MKCEYCGRGGADIIDGADAWHEGCINEGMRRIRAHECLYCASQLGTECKCAGEFSGYGV